MLLDTDINLGLSLASLDDFLVLVSAIAPHHLLALRDFCPTKAHGSIASIIGPATSTTTVL